MGRVGPKVIGVKRVVEQDVADLVSQGPGGSRKGDPIAVDDHGSRRGSRVGGDEGFSLALRPAEGPDHEDVHARGIVVSQERDERSFFQGSAGPMVVEGGEAVGEVHFGDVEGLARVGA